MTKEQLEQQERRDAMELQEQLKKPTNIQIALYLVENYGSGIKEDKLRQVAAVMKLRPNVLIKNYETICRVAQAAEKLQHPTAVKETL